MIDPAGNAQLHLLDKVFNLTMHLFLDERESSDVD